MEAHLCVRNNSYLIFVRNIQKNEPERRSGLKKRTGTPFRCVPVQFEPWMYVIISEQEVTLVNSSFTSLNWWRHSFG